MQIIKPEAKRFYVYIMFRLDKPKGEYIYGEGENQVKFDYEPFYVGKGQGYRFLSHFYPNKLNSTTSNNHKKHIIQKLLKNYDKSEICIIMKKEISHFKAVKLEKLLIKTIGRHDLKTGPLTNMTEGGDGTIGRKCSNKTKSLIAETHLKYEYMLENINLKIKTKIKNLRSFCRKYDLDYRAIGRVIKGKIYSCKGWTGYIIGQEYLRKDIESRHNIRYNTFHKFINPQGEIIETNNISSLSKDNGLDISSLCKVTKGYLAQHKGWKFLETFVKIL